MRSTLGRMQTCPHATRLGSGVTLTAAFRGRITCPACGQALRLPPNVETAVQLVPLLGGAMLSGRINGWIGVVTTLGIVFSLYLACFALASRLVPLRHASAVDAAAARYRVLIVSMLAVGATLVLGGVFAAR